jgi:hypothetical protein
MLVANMLVCRRRRFDQIVNGPLLALHRDIHRKSSRCLSNVFIRPKFCWRLYDLHQLKESSIYPKSSMLLPKPPSRLRGISFSARSLPLSTAARKELIVVEHLRSLCT